nr:hypothetical protein [Tanacetum cinerariifolium]
MTNPEDITDPTTAMNMALALMAKAFKLNYSTPTNNNQRISSNPRNRHIAQLGMNMGQDRQMQMIRGNGGNQFSQYAGQNAGNLNGGLGHFARDCTVRPRRRDAAYLQTQLLIAQKEEAGIQLQAEEYDLMAAAADLDEIEEVNANCILMANLQQASSLGTQTDSAPVYDLDGSAENPVQNPRVQNIGNQNGLIGVPGNANQNLNRNGNLVVVHAEGNAAEHNGNQIRSDLDEIKEVNANCILMANLQQASTSDTQTDKAPVCDSDGSAEVHEYEN